MGECSIEGAFLEMEWWASQNSHRGTGSQVEEELNWGLRAGTQAPGGSEASLGELCGGLGSDQLRVWWSGLGCWVGNGGCPGRQEGSPPCKELSAPDLASGCAYFPGTWGWTHLGLGDLVPSDPEWDTEQGQPRMTGWD